MNRLIFISILLLVTASLSSAEHFYKEKDYQKVWCKQAGGITEYVLDDQVRVDCLTDEYAIEFDFAPKWAEAIGQSLYYALKTKRQAAIVLIMENPHKDERYLNRLKAVAERYNIIVWTISPDELNQKIYLWGEEQKKSKIQ